LPLNGEFHTGPRFFSCFYRYFFHEENFNPKIDGHLENTLVMTIGVKEKKGRIHNEFAGFANNEKCFRRAKKGKWWFNFDMLCYSYNFLFIFVERPCLYILLTLLRFTLFLTFCFLTQCPSSTEEFLK